MFLATCYQLSQIFFRKPTQLSQNFSESPLGLAKLSQLFYGTELNLAKFFSGSKLAYLKLANFFSRPNLAQLSQFFSGPNLAHLSLANFFSRPNLAQPTFFPGSNLAQLFSQICRLLEPPVGRKSGPNFSKVKVIFLNRPKGRSQPQISVRFR